MTIKIPHHVAIVMDGNGRWAQQRGLPRTAGHEAGEAALFDVVEGAIEFGVKEISAYAFSTENWKRTQFEVGGLMRMFKRYILGEAQDLVNEGVRVRFIGDRLRLDKTLVRLMDELEALTAQNAKVHLTIALNYGGRDEVTRAAQRMAGDVERGKLAAKEVTAEVLARYLDTHSLPDPDLVIRTSGEARISNFLLWQSAYAEYEFIDTLWPDFSAGEFTKLLVNFRSRERRFGAIPA